MNKYLSRIADMVLQDDLETIGAIEIAGPKWCGKTTTALRLSNSHVYMSPTESGAQDVAFAMADPGTFLKRKPPFLIDEWQIIPFIWDEIRHQVDARGGEPGQFILTGSAVPPPDHARQHSGAGRIGRYFMRPMSLFESLDSNGTVSLAGLFEGSAQGARCDLELRDYARLTCRGGWPGAVGVPERRARRLLEMFYEKLVTSDISRVDGVNRSEETASSIMKAYSRIVSTQASVATMKAEITAKDDSRPDRKTVTGYINALKKLYVVEDLPAWSPQLNVRTTVRTSDTRHFVDPSLACVSRDFSADDLMGDLKGFGYLFESLAVRDLRVYSQALGGKVFHYRDHNGLEADAVIHLRNGSFALVEVKLFDGNAIDEGADNLKTLAVKLDATRMRAPSFMAVITGTKNAYCRKDGVWVVPLGCLRP